MTTAERIVIVTGSRAWPNYAVVWRALADHSPTLVVHGACPLGADAMAERWCKRMEVDYRGMPARWQTGSGVNKRAGHQRNRRMLETYPGVLVFAFPHGPSPGTRNCMSVAVDLGHPLWVFDMDGEIIHRSGPRPDLSRGV
jgi:hypothetical protein